MENIFMEEIQIFENSMHTASYKFIEALADYDTYFEKFSLRRKPLYERVIDRFKQFVNSFLQALRNFKTQLHIKLNGVMKEKQTKKRLRQMIEELKENKRKGAVKAKTIDVIKYQKVYLQAYDEMWVYAKKFDKTKFSSMEKLDNYLESFNGLYEKYTDILKEIGNEKIELPIDQLIKFCQDELYGNTRVLKTINETETKVLLMKTSAENLEQRKNIIGEDILRKKFGIFHKILNAIGNFIKNAVTRFIMWVVFIFA